MDVSNKTQKVDLLLYSIFSILLMCMWGSEILDCVIPVRSVVLEVDRCLCRTAVPGDRTRSRMWWRYGPGESSPLDGERGCLCDRLRLSVLQASLSSAAAGDHRGKSPCMPCDCAAVQTLSRVLTMDPVCGQRGLLILMPFQYIYIVYPPLLFYGPSSLIHIVSSRI